MNMWKPKAPAVAGLALLVVLSAGCRLAGPPAEAAPVAPEAPAKTAPAETAAPTLADVAVEKGLLTFRGVPVHPGAVRELLTHSADSLPIAVAVDLAGARKANRFGTRPTIKDGAVGFKDELLLGADAFFIYALVGVTPGGAYVLETWESGGGSGRFGSVLVVRFQADREQTAGGARERVLMKRVGEFALGDRDDGKVTLEGNTLRLGKSKYRPADVVVKID